MKTKINIIVISNNTYSKSSFETQLQDAGFYNIDFYESKDQLQDRSKYLFYPFILLDSMSELNFDIQQMLEFEEYENICNVIYKSNEGQELIDLDENFNIISNSIKSSFYNDGYVCAGAYLIQSEEALLDIGLFKNRWKALPMSFRDSYLPSAHYRPCLLLDRDGIINVDTKYLHNFEDVEIYKDIVPIIKYFNDRNLPVCVVTNQSGIARSMYSEKDVVILHKEMGKLLKEMGCEVDSWYYSPFHKEGEGKYNKESLLRKPHGAMALLAARDFPIRLSDSIMIGDKSSDHLNIFGIKTIHVQRGEDLCEAKGVVVESLSDALVHIKKILE